MMAERVRLAGDETKHRLSTTVWCARPTPTTQS
jgi:hypothetical protein